MGEVEVRGGASGGERRWREGMGWRGISSDSGPISSDLGPDRPAALSFGDTRSVNGTVPGSPSSRDINRGGICRVLRSQTNISDLLWFYIRSIHREDDYFK